MVGSQGRAIPHEPVQIEGTGTSALSGCHLKSICVVEEVLGIQIGSRVLFLANLFLIDR